MLTTNLLLLEVVLVLVVPFVVCGWLGRRFGNGWLTAFLGAITATISLVILLFARGLAVRVLSAMGIDNPALGVAWFIGLLLIVYDSVIAETVRYQGLRGTVKDSQNWREAIVFGSGYAGIEAIFLSSSAIVLSLNALSNSEVWLAETIITTEQLDILRAQGWWFVLLRIWGSTLIYIFHLVATLWLAQAVDTTQFSAQKLFKYWGLAVSYRGVLYAVPYISLGWVALIAANLLLSVLAAIWISVIMRIYREEKAIAPTLLDERKKYVLTAPEYDKPHKP